MKVLFVSEYWEPHGQGGGEISAAMLARALVKNGIDVHVLTSTFPGAMRYERKEGVAIHRALTTSTTPTGVFSSIKRMITFPRSVRAQLTHILTHEQFDIIHYFNATSALGAIKTTIPQLVHVNSPVFFCPKGTLMYQDKHECHYKCTPTRFLRCFVKSHEFGKTKNAWYLKWNPAIWLALYLSWRKRLTVLRGFSCVTPNSAFMDTKLHEIGIPDDRITIVPNVVLMTKTGIRQKTPDGKQRVRPSLPRILYAGAYIESKGVLDLLNALKDITLPYACHLYGSGELKERLQTSVTTNQLNNITIHDAIPHDELLKLYDSFDIVVQPSLVAEAMPRSVLEALGAGKAVVTSNVGGAKGVITHGETGILYDPYEQGALRRALEMVLRDKTFRDTLAANARHTVEPFTEKNVARTAQSLYSHVIKKAFPLRTVNPKQT